MSADQGLRLPRFLVSYGLLIAALVLELIVFEVTTRVLGKPSFLTAKSLLNVLDQSAAHAVIAVGMTFVILTAGIDLSIGSVIALGGVVAAKVVLSGGEPTWLWLGLGALAGLLVGLAAGGVSGTLITFFRVPPFIATLALMSSLRGLARIVTRGRPVSPLPEGYEILGRFRIGGLVPLDVLVMLAVFILGAVILNTTRFGRHVLAIGGSEESARLSGVPVARVTWIVYAMSGLLAAFGGLIVSSKLGSGDPNVGMGDELNVIAAVVVGGTSLMGGRGSIGGTFVGLLIVSVLSSGLNWVGVETFGQQVILGAVILGAVLLDRFKGDA
jgi:ribose/xylose/arabinose/galactoside ABC-type transport system permease subunit